MNVPQLVVPGAVLAVLVLCADRAMSQDVRNGLYLPLDEIEVVSSAGASVGLEGNAVFCAPDFQVLVDIDPDTDRPTSIAVSVDLDAALTLEVSADGGGEFEYRIRPAPVLLQSIPFGGAVEVIPVIEFDFTVSGRAEAGMRLSVVQELHSSLSATIGEGAAQPMPPEPRSYARASAPEVSGGTSVGLRVSVQATVTFLIVYQGITLGGPSFRNETALQLVVQPSRDPWWDLDLDVELGIGVGGIGDRDIEPVWTRRLDIADAEEPFPVHLPLTRWSKVYGLEPYVNAASITPWEDGFALAGRAGGGWFAGLGEDGTPRWEKEGAVVVGGSTDPCELQALPDGGLVTAGADGVQARIERLDAIGDLLWTRRYLDNLGGLVRVNSLITRPDGGLVFAGLVGRSFDQQAAIVWLDQDGFVEDALEVDLGTADDETLFEQIIPTVDGGWAAVGNAVYEDHPDIGERSVDGQNGWIVKISADHDLVFAKVVGGMGYDRLHAITELDDGALVAAGGVGSEEHAAWLICLEADGSKRWSGTYAGRDNPYGTLTSVAAVEGAGAVAAGTSGIGSDTDAWLMRVDTRGMPVWLKSLSAPAALDELLEMRTLEDGLIAAGLTHSLVDDPIHTASQAWVVRTNIDGMLDLDPGLGFDVVNDTAHWADTSYVAVVDVPAIGVPSSIHAADAVLELESVSSSVTVVGE